MNDWEVIGSYGEGYSFHYSASAMDGVPQWVNESLKQEMPGDPEDYADWDVTCYELTGRNYWYRAVPMWVEQGSACVSGFRRKKTAKGQWQFEDRVDRPYKIERYWLRHNWQGIGQIKWPKSGGMPNFAKLHTLMSVNQPTVPQVPEWIQKEFNRRMDTEGAPVYDSESGIYYELTGKKFSYRILLTEVEDGRVKAEVFKQQRNS